MEKARHTAEKVRTMSRNRIMYLLMLSLRQNSIDEYQRSKRNWLRNDLNSDREWDSPSGA